MATTNAIITTLTELQKQIVGMPPLLSDLLLRDYGNDHFVLLIGCILSLRARDTMAYPVCKQLFSSAPTPQVLAQLSRLELETILRPIGFYRTKAATIQHIAQILISDHAGTVPTCREALLALPGVGQKTVQFMRCYAQKIPALCVDTHVHRLANRFQWIQTETPQETEDRLIQLIPEEWWCEVNRILVTWGQQVCTSYPISAQKRKRHDALCPCTRR